MNQKEFEGLVKKAKIYLLKGRIIMGGIVAITCFQFIFTLIVIKCYGLSSMGGLANLLSLSYCLYVFIKNIESIKLDILLYSELHSNTSVELYNKYMTNELSTELSHFIRIIATND